METATKATRLYEKKRTRYKIHRDTSPEGRCGTAMYFEWQNARENARLLAGVRRLDCVNGWPVGRVR